MRHRDTKIASRKCLRCGEIKGPVVGLQAVYGGDPKRFTGRCIIRGGCKTHPTTSPRKTEKLQNASFLLTIRGCRGRGYRGGHSRHFCQPCQDKHSSEDSKKVSGRRDAAAGSGTRKPLEHLASVPSMPLEVSMIASMMHVFVFTTIAVVVIRMLVHLRTAQQALKKEKQAKAK